MMGYESPLSFHSLRHDIRFPVDFKAMLHWDGSFASVDVADISNSGIRLTGLYLPPMGTIIRLAAKSLDAKGRVVWRTPRGCGIMLSYAIDALHVVRANCFPDQVAEA